VTIATPIDAVMRLFGTNHEPPLAAQRYRSVLASQHGMNIGDEWTWSAQAAEGVALAVILVATIRLTLVGTGAVRQEVPAGTLLFLHPDRAARVIAAGQGTAMCVWVPWAVLREVESCGCAPAELIPPSDLGQGLGAVLDSLLTETSERTPYTEPLVERMLTEMTFAVLSDAASRRALSVEAAPSRAVA
jgi:hypothetical protein